MPSAMHITSGSCADGQDCLALHQTYLILSDLIYCYLILSTWILSCDQHQWLADYPKSNTVYVYSKGDVQVIIPIFIDDTVGVKTLSMF